MSKFVKTHKGLRRRWTLDLILGGRKLALTDDGRVIFGKMYTHKNRNLMAKVSSNRTFNGHLYLIDDVHSTKDGAQYYAKAHRFEGRKARVIPSKYGYILYVRLEQ
jgi:hypothetical protein